MKKAIVFALMVFMPVVAVAGEVHLRKNSAAELVFPMIDKNTPEVFKSGESVTDTCYYRDAGAWTTLDVTDTATEIGSTGMYQLDLSASELNHNEVICKFSSTNSADTAWVIRTFANDIDSILELREGNVRKTFFLAAVPNATRKVGAGRIDYIKIETKADDAVDWTAPTSTKYQYFWYDKLGDTNPVKVGENN